LKYDVDNSANAEGLPPMLPDKGAKEYPQAFFDHTREYAFSLACDTIAKSHLFVSNYQPAYHPRSYLRNRMKECYEELIRIKTLHQDMKRRSVPNGLGSGSKALLELEVADIEAANAARRLQDTIIERYDALHFAPNGFLPVEYVLGKSEEMRDRHQEAVHQTVPAYFAVGEQSKIEILCTLASHTSSFLREVALHRLPSFGTTASSP
jgi:hypothetical protein